MPDEGLNFSALQKGDPIAWQTAFSHFWPIALRAANHPQAFLVPWEREEVAHEAILDWINHFETVANLDEAKALLITIAYRRAISAARRKYAAKRCASPELAKEFADTGLSIAEPFCDSDRGEITLLLKKVLDTLEPDTRLLLMDKIERELTYEEISTRRNIPLGTVCTKVARALKRIREQLKQTPLVMKELREYLR
jgi:RNA polymerase sigma factor (sigma-70 family)